MGYTEPQLNGSLAKSLRTKHPQWNEKVVVAESTQTLRESAGLQPDILVQPKGRAPVCIEAERDPAHTVDKDARERLGLHTTLTGSKIESAVALIYPEQAARASLSEVSTGTFRIALHTLSPKGKKERYPPEGYLESDINLLSSVIDRLTISESVLAHNTQIFIDTISEGQGLIAHDGNLLVQKALGKALHQEHGEQTNKMTCAILSSALVFHVTIEGQPDIPGVPTPASISRGVLMDIWEEILDVNYFPIFEIARNLIEQIPTKLADRLMRHLARSVSPIVSTGAASYQGLCGKMFQQLITDRKLLATFYTLPSSACLLAELAIGRMIIEWGDKKSIQELRIGDFACGTGALLSAVQYSVNDKIRMHGGDDSIFHQTMMESVLTGLDIMPAATHLTSAILSSAHPATPYWDSQVITMPFGTRQSDGGISIGSLDFLKGENQAYLFGSERVRVRSGSADSQEYNLPVHSFDLVIMNPPFTRNCGQEGKKKGIPSPAFAAFDTSAGEQAAMVKELKDSKQEAGNGQAGPASNFIDLADTRVKPNGGVIALVLPFTFLVGAAWKKARAVLKKKYRDIHILSIAHENKRFRSFSDSTGMAECLVVATKRPAREIVDREGGGTAWFENLTHNIAVTTLDYRPESLCEALLLARKQEMGASVSCVTSDKIHEGGVLSREVIRFGNAIGEGVLKLPGSTHKWNIPITTLGEIAEKGVYHTKFMPGYSSAVFSNHPIGESDAPTYPMLWAHDSKTQTRFTLQCDRYADPLDGRRQKAMEVWQKTASRYFCNTNFQVNSQRFVMCATKTKALGGRAWTNVIPRREEHAIPLLLWLNSTMGIVSFWYNGTRQQHGRANVTMEELPKLPVLDCSTLSIEQIEKCNILFGELRDTEFMSAHKSHQDDARHTLDERLLVDVLGFGDVESGRGVSRLMEGVAMLRAAWCNEPIVHAGKRS